MYSSSRGELRAALDALLAELHANRRIPARARRLALIAQDVARRWHCGAAPRELAALIFAEVGS
jgi:hypothetical protein